MDAVLVGAIVEDTNWGDGMATVTVSLPARDVWTVINSQIMIVRRQ